MITMTSISSAVIVALFMIGVLLVAQLVEWCCYTGTVIDTASKGKLNSITSYKNGKVVIRVKFYKNGNVFSRTTNYHEKVTVKFYSFRECNKLVGIMVDKQPTIHKRHWLFWSRHNVEKN